MASPARAFWFLALATACAPAPPPVPQPAPPSEIVSAPPDACVVAGDTGREADTVAVALDPPPSGLLPPLTGSDWFDWARGYETLIRLDCDSVPRPALAIGWKPDSVGAVWVLDLAGQVSPEGIDEIVRQWTPPPRRLALAGVRSLQRRGEHELQVNLAAPNDSLLRVLAHPALALRLSTVAPGRNADLPGFRAMPRSADLRDALDAGADMVVTTDPATLDYARRRADLEIVPLPWSSVYAMVSPGPLTATQAHGFRAALARDVARADARAAAAPECPAAGGLATAAGSQLAYLAGDPTAASLAARLVALGAAGPRGTVLPLPRSEIQRRLGLQQLAGAVLPFPTLGAELCPPEAAGYAVTPLVETRAHLVTRQAGPAIRRDGFGVLRVDRRPVP